MGSEKTSSYKISSEQFNFSYKGKQQEIGENPKVKEVENFFTERLFGQPEVVKAVATRIANSEYFLLADKPKGGFLLYGSPGTGKTETSKVTAQYFHGDKWEENYKKISGEDLTEKHSLFELIGSPPSYVGYGDEPLISADFLKKPNNVIMFDELEKAHPDIRKYWLSVLDDGTSRSKQKTGQYSAKNNVLRFNNTWLFFSANIGSKEMTKTPVGLSVNQEAIAQKGKAAFKQYFEDMPEFVSRLGEDNAIMTRPLSNEDYDRIANKFLSALNKSQKGPINPIYVTDNFLNKIYQEAQIDKYGAREIWHKIQKYVAPEAANVKGTLKPKHGETIILEFNAETNKVLAAIGPREDVAQSTPEPIKSTPAVVKEQATAGISAIKSPEVVKKIEKNKNSMKEIYKKITPEDKALYALIGGATLALLATSRKK